MRISDALSKAREIDVTFANDVLHVTYRPISYTLEELDRIQTEASQTGGNDDVRRARMSRIIEMIQRLVLSWDLTDDDGKPIEISNSDAMRALPMNIFTEILGAVRQDQNVGEASGGASAAS